VKRVFVNGTFDLLHPGHVSLLQFAREQGDWLRVAIDTDQRVTRLKGAGRPIQDQHSRVMILGALRSVDEVMTFDTDQDLLDLMAGHDVMVKGSDYRDLPILGSDTGIEIVFFPRIKRFSTSSTIQRFHAGG
jgi:rfaE bifunctional protein nucleotidyltransferase chain/domain